MCYWFPVTFWKGTREFQASGGRTTLESTENAHTMIRAPVKQRDAGEYTIVVQNSYGKAVTEIQVVVTPATGPKKPTEEVPAPAEGEPPSPAPPKGVPGPPTGEPVAEQIGANSLTLVWGKPSEDGGSAIEAYRIEQRSPDSQTWSEIGQCASTKYDVRDLKPDTEYLFQVSARNQTVDDWGESSEMSAPVRTLKVGRKPVFRRPLIPDMRMNEGKALTLEAAADGQPQPVLRWFKDNMEIEESARITIEYGKKVGDICRLKIKKLEPEDEGVYTCTAENETGFASTSSNVEIISAIPSERT